MTHPWRGVATIFIACSLCLNVPAQDTYTQGSSTERRAPAETKPVDDQTVVTKLTVRPNVQRDPDEIESAISRALVVSPATEAFEIQVHAEPDGSVRLTGNVDSWAERELVERVASTVAGVTSIDNEVYVD